MNECEWRMIYCVRMVIITHLVAVRKLAHQIYSNAKTLIITHCVIIDQKFRSFCFAGVEWEVLAGYVDYSTVAVWLRNVQRQPSRSSFTIVDDD